MDRRSLLAAIAGGVAAASLPFALATEAAAAPAARAPTLDGVRSALQPATAEPQEMQWRGPGWRRRRYWRRRYWGGRPIRRRRCWINRRGFRVCRW